MLMHGCIIKKELTKLVSYVTTLSMIFSSEIYYTDTSIT